MDGPTEVRLSDVTVAYVFIKAHLGQPSAVAAQVSALPGVRWTVVVTGQFDVIAGVRVANNEELGDLVVAIQNVPGVSNPTTAVMTSYYEGGERKPAVFNGPP